ncbi:hypothetical protein Tco_1515425 [Tanacetum coccineum]
MLYNALIQSLFMDENDMDQAATAMGQSAQLKRRHDDQDEDPTAGLDQGKDKKRPRKDTQPLKKSYASKESSKENVVDKMGNVEEQPDGEAAPKTNNSPKNDWFKQPPRPPTPDLEWNKCQDVYSSLKILIVVSVKVNKLHGYGYLEEIMVRRADRQLYKFKEGNFVNLHLNDIEDMLLLIVQHKLFDLNGDVIVDLAVALRMFTRNLIIKKRVEDVQLGVESYQKKLNIIKPQKDFLGISAKEPYTPSFDPKGVVY